jgi:peptidyl-tRNA hydrolase
LIVERYVLEPCTDDEIKMLPDITTRVSNAVTMILSSGIQAAMNQYNEISTNQKNKGDAPLPS